MKASENNLLRLLQGSKVFLVPNFQRRYSWRKGEWEQLWDDLLRECRRPHDAEPQTLDGHFLGSVVLHPAPGGASVLMKHLVVDGQQRLTTALILIAALRDVGAELEIDSWNPAEYNDKYLVNQYDQDYPDRLVPTKLDRVAYTRTMRERTPTEGIGQAYSYFSKRIREVVRSSDPALRLDLKTIADTLLLNMLVVEINTTPGDSVNNIFNRLNSKGMQLSAADLVRNELLLNLTEAEADEAYEQYWMPMETSLVTLKPGGERDDRRFVTFLWAREVVFDPSTTRRNLFLTFERRFRAALRDVPLAERSTTALGIFRSIHADHELFLLLQDPLGPARSDLSIGPEFREALDKLRRWGSEPSTPFALWLLREAVAGRISDIEATGAVEVLLGYLIRRTLAGVPTNQLNRLLTPLANQLAGRGSLPLLDRLRDILGQHGYHWPSDAEVLGAVVRQPLYLSSRKQVGFLLAEAERLLQPSSQIDAADAAVEHVMPQGLPGGWTEYVLAGGGAVDDALSLVHTLGNLTAVTEELDGNEQPFEAKKQSLAASPLALNREIAAMESWLPDDIESRGVRLAGLLIGSLPAPPRSPRGDSPRSESEVIDRLENALQSLPDGRWTSEDDLLEYLAADRSEVRALVSALGPELARLVRNRSGGIPVWFPADQADAVRAQDLVTLPGSHATADELRDFESAAEAFADGGESSDATGGDERSAP